MNRVVRILLAALLVAAALPVAAQSSTTGSVRGTVTDPQGGVLPGVTVIARSDALVAGQQVAITSENGSYRFPSLAPGVYSFEASLDGFRPVRRDDIKVDLGVSLDLDLRLELGAMTDEIVVVAEGAQVSTVTNTVSFNLTGDFLDKMPLPRDVGSLMNYTPGVTDGRAYGSPNNQGTAYNLDGVDVSDPASGQQWISPNFDWVQEVQVTGLGADAEYGGFTGGLVNVVTKSGGNELHGDGSVYYSSGSLSSENAPEGVTAGAKLDQDLDVSISLGGKIVQDKLWYFVSAQQRDRKLDPFYYNDTPAGEIVKYDRMWHRYLGKLTSQVSDASRLVGLVAIDNITTDNRNAGDVVLGSGAYNQDSPNWSYNATWEYLANDSNFFSFKATGFTGTNDSLPKAGRSVPGREDLDSGFQWENYRWNWLEDKTRLTVDASWSLFVDGLFSANDSHEFKFGVVYDDATQDEVRSRNAGYTIIDDSYYCDALSDYFADPFCGVYSSDRGNEINLHGVQKGWDVYAQDSWRMKRVTLNVGARYSSYTGGFDGGNTSVYDVSMIAPRIGAVVDLTGDGRTALKVHYGRYYDALMTFMYDRERSGNVFSATEYYDYNFDTGAFDDPAGGRAAASALMDPNISHPYVDQYVVTFEQQLTSTMKIGIDYLNRKNHDIIAMVNTNTDYDALVAQGNPLTGGTLPFYELLDGPDYELTNPAGAYRDYDAVIGRFVKRFQDGWSLDASLVWSDLKGNTDDVDGYEPAWSDRNGQINNDGKLSNHSDWEFKLNAAVLLPWEITASAHYRYSSGTYWTPYVEIRGLYKNDRTDVNLLPRGSMQLDDRNLVDLRLEKTFRVGGDVDMSVIFDVFNLFNSNTVLAVSEQWGRFYYDYREYPTVDPENRTNVFVSSSSYGQPLTIEDPREIRLGLRVSF
jgi:hypothetical protein